MSLFRKKETNQEIGERLFKLTDQKDYGIFAPPMEAQVAVDELCRYFLGEDWYSVNPLSAEQINTEIVYEIECKFKKCKAKKRRDRLWMIKKMLKILSARS